jgi:hypothetical protein
VHTFGAALPTLGTPLVAAMRELIKHLNNKIKILGPIFANTNT